LNTALKVNFVFYLQIPATTTKRRKSGMLSGRIRPTKKPDCSNLIKLYEDCMTGYVYEDDRFIVAVSAEKFWAERPCTIITISQIEEDHETPE
jgi:Holliday junction resolvase RusA-like endonuclease